MHDPLPAFATVAELETRLNTQLDSEQAAQAQMVLESASNLVRGCTGKDWVDEDGNLSGTPAQLAKLNTLTLDVVKRAATNPTGTVQETAGPFNRSFGANAADNLWLTALEKRACARLGRGGLWTQPTTRGPVETPRPPVDRKVVLDADAILEG